MARFSPVGGLIGLVVALGLGYALGLFGPSRTGYDASWPKPTPETTCDDFVRSMTGAQRFGFSAAMLFSARQDRSTADPGRDLVAAFEADVTAACQAMGPTTRISRAGAAAYLGNRKYQP